jgi:heme-degrading monooxygenase HmoA
LTLQKARSTELNRIIGVNTRVEPRRYLEGCVSSAEVRRQKEVDANVWGCLMFIVIISFPPIKDGKDAEFQEWFTSSNQAFSNSKGFISRRLLKPVEGGNYAAIVEFENQAAFQAMHSSSIHDRAGEQVRPLFDGKPTPKFYEVIVG